MGNFRRAVGALTALLIVGCGGGSTSSSGGGGGGGGGGGAGGVGGAGIALPTEISALPAKLSATAALRGVARSRSALSSDPDSDYARASSVKSVDEQALSQFDIFNVIFKALGQTHYAEPSNVNAGPYGTMVSWEESHGDSQQKRLVPWVVDSSLVEVAGKTTNRVLVWMLEPGEDGAPQLVKVRLDIEEPPTQRTDGSYSDYGVWRIDAKLGESSAHFFSASATREGADSVVKVHEGGEPGHEVRGILRRADGQGSGKVEFPDWSACQGPECAPVTTRVAYVYDAATVALKKGAAPVVFKDRSGGVDLVRRYGLYDAATGADVARTRSFGFPLRWNDAQGRPRHGYYGAWQGRHQIWADGATIPAGTTVARGDRPPDAQPETFTVSEPLVGTLVKRTLVPADVQDVRNLAVETWVNRNASLRWTGSSWYECVNPDHSSFPPTCGAGSGTFEDLDSLAYNPNDRRRSVHVDTWDQVAQRPIRLVYLRAGPAGAGFYTATGGENGTPPMPTETRFVPQPDQQIWVNVNGSVYVAFDGVAWVQKTLVAFDERTWTPTFDPAGDRPFTLELGREYYINNPGANYVVKRAGPASYDVKIEVQSVANPANAASFVAAGTVFRPQWGGNGTTFAFVTDAASPSYLKLVYATVAEGDQTPGAAPGAVVTQGQWGLVALDAGGSPTGLQFNWDYPRQGESFGAQQFLQGADGSYRLLDDPIRLAPVVLTTRGGQSKTYSLQFDGSWVNGLPDLWQDLRKAGFVVDADLAAKVVVIPAGQEVVDAADPSKRYVFKPLVTSQYLTAVADPRNLDVAPASALDLSTVPAFREHGMGASPEVPLKYSEGKPVR